MRTLYARMNPWRPYVLSIVRIVAGLLFLQFGLAKFFGFPVAGPELKGLFIPAAILETFGGLLLVAGAYTRIAAFLLSGEMAAAYFIAHAPQSFYPAENEGTLAVLFCFVFLYLAFAGGGAWSLDRAALKQE